FISCRFIFFFFQAEDGIRDGHVTGVQTCALPISALTGLGSMIVFCGNTFRTAELFLPMVVLAILSVVITNLIYRVEVWIAPWRRSEERRVGKECRSRWWPQQHKVKESRTMWMRTA